jgi:hypothetical protein
VKEDKWYAKVDVIEETGIKFTTEQMEHALFIDELVFVLLFWA